MNLETIRSSFDQKIRSGMFKPITRRLHADMAEDRAQEGLALTYEIYRQHALQGDVLDNALLVFSARVRAEDLGRNVVRCNGRARKFCVMDGVLPASVREIAVAQGVACHPKWRMAHATKRQVRDPGGDGEGEARYRGMAVDAHEALSAA